MPVLGVAMFLNADRTLLSGGSCCVAADTMSASLNLTPATTQPKRLLPSLKEAVERLCLATVQCATRASRHLHCSHHEQTTCTGCLSIPATTPAVDGTLPVRFQVCWPRNAPPSARMDTYGFQAQRTAVFPRHYQIGGQQGSCHLLLSNQISASLSTKPTNRTL
jgi:hypothetical protein